jgi:mannosylglycoprotein endo-beta-mannosidase
LSFFTRIRLEDKHGKPIKPAFYSDNFFSLLPGEAKNIVITIPRHELQGDKINLFIDGWNVKSQEKTFQVAENKKGI